ncbi:MAG: xanthine dehydrogenase family protein molybdopterin-binding subunit [Novosphingobium sp.]|nr:xanthine dehydrogenase family protein molybdopterin-binding subunit [Novosphingobium sp.]MCP5402477.1 xanthine dehydrogenase family protein molybdopterin-binding subunit [Novosphingobium sp.]
MNAPQDKRSFRYVGTRPVRPDGVEKVTGKALYGPDFVAPNMLHGAILRSPHAHARIKSIDLRKAEALPGVKAIVTGADFPTLESLIMAVGESSSDIVHISRNCMAYDKVLYDGHAVAAVAATSGAIARQAIKLIDVEYEVLPHVLDIEEALRADAPVLHEDIFTKGVNPKPDKPSNAALRVEMAKGDLEEGFGKAAVVVSGRYTTEPVHQGYIEPHACVVSWNADGQLQIWTSSQGHFAVRSLTASVLGLSQADIRVTPLEIGGGFGGKTTIYLEPVATLLSRKSGRPVRLAMSRSEVFRASGPAPGAVIDLKMGAAEDGTLVAADIEFKYHAGAYPAITAHSGASSAIAHYKVPNSRVVGWEVLCNRPATKAYRAPGAPQVIFAVECALDELAGKLGIDPVDFRLKNAVRPGDKQFNGMPFGEIGYAECLEAAKAHPHWSAPLGPNQGRGVAGGTWGNYGGPSTAEVSVAEDGSVLVTTGSPDIGGSRASMAIMAAETLQIPYEKIRVTIADTSSIGFSMVTGGSRTTFATGKAVTDAAAEVVEILKERAARTWGVEPSEVDWRDGEAVCLAEGRTDERLPIGRIAGSAPFSGGPISAEAAINPGGYLAGYGVHICDTEVDPETGHVKILRYTAIQDVGQAIHPDYVEGQMQGGAVQGIGWALNEAYLYDKDGRLDNPGFLDYRVPVASDVPMIDTVMIEKANPDHPYGVKGVGEVPIVPPLAAVANAVTHAAGVRMADLPLTPDRVYAALRAAE